MHELMIERTLGIIIFLMYYIVLLQIKQYRREFASARVCKVTEVRAVGKSIWTCGHHVLVNMSGDFNERVFGG